MSRGVGTFRAILYEQSYRNVGSVTLSNSLFNRKLRDAMAISAPNQG